MFFSRRLHLVLPLLLTLGACAGATPSDDASETEQATKITPKDSENLGKIQVNVPSGWVLPPNPSDDASASYVTTTSETNALTFGSALRIKAASGCVQVHSKFNSPSRTCGVDVVKNQTTTTTLGAIKAVYDPAATLAVDFGPVPTFSIFQKPSAAGAEAKLYDHAPNGYLAGFWNGASTRPVLAAPGDYRFAWNLPVLGEVKKTLAQGENATVALVPNDVRATITLKPPSARELPDAPAGACQTKARTFVIQRRADATNGIYEPPAYDQKIYQAQPASYPNGYVSSYSTQENVVAYRAVAVSQITSLKVFPFTAGEAPMHYEVVVNNLPATVDVKPGTTSTVQLERLDVDDVEVEKEDGSKYKAKGTWQVWRQGPNATWVPVSQRVGQYSDCSGYGAATQANYPTGTGLDVLAGTYRVVVSYSTAEGGKTQDFTVSVP